MPTSCSRMKPGSWWPATLPSLSSILPFAAATAGFLPFPPHLLGSCSGQSLLAFPPPTLSHIPYGQGGDCAVGDIWWWWAIRRLCSFSLVAPRSSRSCPADACSRSCQPNFARLGKHFWWKLTQQPSWSWWPSSHQGKDSHLLTCLPLSIQMLLACPSTLLPFFSEIKIISSVTVSSLIILDADRYKMSRKNHPG